ncbi:hypothetical protein [Alteromonas sp. W364]|uniref:hypothetical protein n=1 Tax=Alteromonas sp. W364 TaxID=3075610 RepID=UPI002885D275|nr:hypothetical protein [Alteromonas sp. W364]MDT0627020.1 hypothetical protein [Alteromonas sp. W364]
MIKSTPFVVAIAITLSACGGSSNDGQSSGRSPLPPPEMTESVGSIDPILTVNNVELYGDQSFSEGGSYGFAVITNDGSRINSVNWEQTAGPSLSILATQSRTIGFDVPVAGDYAIDVTVNTTSGTQALSYDFTAASAEVANANIRLDHTVTERGKVSIRVGSLSHDISTATVEWNQLAGSAVLNMAVGESQANLLTFDIPTVNRDEILQFEAQVSFADGSEATDLTFITIADAIISDDAYFPSNNIITTQDIRAFNPDSPYKSALESCVYTNTLSSTCTFGTLPLLGQQTDTPSIQDVLDRTLVSHDWMGERFKQYLEQSLAGPDMLQLLRGVTAVVISYDVRPSFYWTATGAIYLDADNFWVTPEERDTLNEAPDYRSGFSSDLSFRIFWRYVKDNEAYMPGRQYPIAARESRSFDVLEADISWLMYHELAHANDFFPYIVWSTLRDSDDPRSYFNNNGAKSDEMIANFPLASSQMKGLAQVSFAGDTASATQRNYAADDIQSFFSPDSASSYYSYLNEREDYATLFERFMMQYRLGASADLGILNTVNNNNLLVTWGQRDRFNDPKVQARARYTVSQILPQIGNIRDIQDNELPAPLLLRSGIGWFDNIDLSEQGENAIQIPLRPEETSILEAQHLHKGRPTLE